MEWQIKDGEIVVRPVRTKFLRFKNTIRVGKGDVTSDIKLIGKEWAKKI